jgi:hypothetical protein
MLASLYPPPTAAVSSVDGDVDGIGYRIYTPVEAAKSGPLPVGLYTHGGGFVLGDLNAEDVLCRAIAEHAGCILVSVDYRLAPEHKAPAQLTDCLNVLKWVCLLDPSPQPIHLTLKLGSQERQQLRRRRLQILHHWRQRRRGPRPLRRIKNRRLRGDPRLHQGYRGARALDSTPRERPRRICLGLQVLH